MAFEDLVATARQLAAAIERGETGAALVAFCHPDSLQEEFPNQSDSSLVAPTGTLPTGGEMRARRRQILERERGEVLRVRNDDCIYPW